MIQFNLLCASYLLFLTLNDRVCCVFQFFQKNDGEGMMLQGCKAAVLQVFINMNVSDVLTHTVEKCFPSSWKILIVRSVLINKSVF